MNTIWQVARLLFLTACCLSASARDSLAQKKTIEIFRGSEGTRDGQPIVDRIPSGRAAAPAATGGTGQPPTAAPAPLPVRDPKLERQQKQHAESVRTISRVLADKSFDSYSRGLMPLEDHLEQLNLATSANYQLAKDAASQAVVASAHRQDVERILQALEDAQKVLGFEGAPGFTADLALSRAMLAQADVEIASLRNDKSALAAASEQAIGFAQQHLEIRRIDMSLGIATLSQLTHATLLTPEGFANGQTLLSDVVDQRRAWAAANASGGLGRADYLAESELELARFRYFTALDTKNQTQAAEQLAAARTAADQIYATKLEYQASGTASMYDVARAWNLRRDVHLMAGPESKTAREDATRDKTDFERVNELAASTTDLRGRNAADVSYVTLLRLVNEY